MLQTEMTLEARYFERMAVGLGDKLRIVEALPEPTAFFKPRVLDVGAGGGELSAALHQLGFAVVALDENPHALAMIQNNFPEIEVMAASANALGEEKFDAIVCSSVLHEVYSYPDTNGRTGIENVSELYEVFINALNPGGRLIIRDGVKPANWNDQAKVKVLNGSPLPVSEFLRLSPYANGLYSDVLSLTETSDSWYEGTVESVYEFYMTYNWGLDSYHRETQEFYGFITLEDNIALLIKTGFTVLEANAWVQKEYREFLPKKVEISTLANEALDWFPTNALWVAER